MNKIAKSFAAASAVALTVPAHAATLFQSVSTFDAAGMGDFAFNIASGSFGGEAPQQLYNAFTLDADSIITDFLIDLEGETYNAGTIDFQVYAADDGRPTGAALYSTTLGTAVTRMEIPNTFIPSYLHAYDFADFNLAAGNYVVSLVSADRNATLAIAQWTNAARTGFLARGLDGEASSGSYVTNRGTAFAINGDVIAAGVPEPATWALMILGFGAVGGALRRRSSVRLRFA